MKKGDSCTVSHHYEHTDTEKVFVIEKIVPSFRFESGTAVKVEGMDFYVDSGLVNVIPRAAKSPKKKSEFSRDYPTEYMALCQLKAANEELRRELDKAKGVQEYKTAEQFVRELDWLTTKEFCDKYDIEIPSWKGNVQLAASEFIRLDAIKWNMTKEFVKHEMISPAK